MNSYKKNRSHLLIISLLSIGFIFSVLSFFFSQDNIIIIDHPRFSQIDIQPEQLPSSEIGIEDKEYGSESIKISDRQEVLSAVTCGISTKHFDENILCTINIVVDPTDVAETATQTQPVTTFKLKDASTHDLYPGSLNGVKAIKSLAEYPSSVEIAELEHALSMMPPDTEGSLYRARIKKDELINSRPFSLDAEIDIVDMIPETDGLKGKATVDFKLRKDYNPALSNTTHEFVGQALSFPGNTPFNDTAQEKLVQEVRDESCTIAFANPSISSEDGCVTGAQTLKTKVLPEYTIKTKITSPLGTQYECRKGDCTLGVQDAVLLSLTYPSEFDGINIGSFKTSTGLDYYKVQTNGVILKDLAIPIPVRFTHDVTPWVRYYELKEFGDYPSDRENSIKKDALIRYVR